MSLHLLGTPDFAPLVPRLAWILFHTLWQGMVIAALLWVILRIVHENHSRIRYGIACSALVLLTFAPVVTGVFLGEFSPAQRSREIEITNGPGKRERTRPSTNDSLIGTSPQMESQTSEALLSESNQTVGQTTAQPFLWVELGEFIQSVQHLVDRTAGLLVTLWLLGVVISAVRLSVSFQMVRSLRRSASPVNDAVVLQKFSRLIERLRLDPQIGLYQSSSAIVPTVLDWFRPIVLLPLSYPSRLTLDQVEALLAHELAHIQRHDYLCNVLQNFVETVLFYHPAAWWMSNVIRNEREHCCDEIAIGLVNDRQLYASSLFELAKMASPSQLAISANGGRLKDRIRRVLNVLQSGPPAIGPAIGLSVGFVVLLCVSAIASSQVGTDNSGSDKTTVLEEKAVDATANKTTGQPTKPLLGMQRMPHGTGKRGAEYFDIIEFPVVQKELGLNDESIANIKLLCQQFRAELEAGLPSNGLRWRTILSSSGAQVTFQEATRDGLAVFKAAVNKFQPKLKALLTPQQYARLQQIVWQEIGIAAFTDDDLIAALNITQDQQDRIAAINDEYYLTRLQINRVAGPERRELDRQRRQLGIERDAKILNVLPKELQERFVTLKGKSFELDQLRGEVRRQRRLFGRQARMLALVDLAAVQKDLGLSADDEVRVTELVNQFQKTIIKEDDERPRRDETDEQRSLFQENLKKIRETNLATASTYFAKLLETITPEQSARLQQIFWQERRLDALSDPEMIKLLPISKELQDGIKAVQKDYELKWNELSAGEVNYQPRITDSKSNQERQIQEVLTQAQQAQFTVLIGKEFFIPQSAHIQQTQQSYAEGHERLQRSIRAQGLPAGSRRVGIAEIPRRPFLSLAENHAVQKELGLSPAEVERINKFGSDVRIEVQKSLGDLPDFERMTGEELKKAKELIEKTDQQITETFVPQLKEILTKDQFNRLKQIHWQLRDLEALLDLDIVAAISLSKIQQDELSSVLSQDQPQSEPLRVLDKVTINTIFMNLILLPGRDQQNTRREQSQAGLQQRRAQVDAILTREQQEKLSELKGKAFDTSLLRQ